MTPVLQLRWLRSSAPPRDLQLHTQALWWHQRHLRPCQKQGQHRTEEDQHLHKALWTVETFHHHPLTCHVQKVKYTTPTKYPAHPTSSFNTRFINLLYSSPTSLTYFVQHPKQTRTRRRLIRHWWPFPVAVSCACSISSGLGWLAKRASSMAVSPLAWRWTLTATHRICYRLETQLRANITGMRDSILSLLRFLFPPSFLYFLLTSFFRW